MISLSALLTTLRVMNSQANNHQQQQQAAVNNTNNNNHNNNNNQNAGLNNAVGVAGIHLAPGGGGGGGGIVVANNQNPAAEGSMERGSCLLRYASQNSLDESSQKHIQRPNNKDRTVGHYHNELHTTRSFVAMNEMRKQNLLCDVTLVAENIEIPAHKMVLASCSPYFYAMFTGFEESRQGRITLQGVDHSALELLIEYVYTSTVEVNEDNVQVLLTAANLLQLTDVRDACCDYLQTQLDASNCLGIRDFADMHGCLDLLSYADSYIIQHFNEVIQFDEFLHLTHEQVINLIRNDSISVFSEEKVYECVISWIRFDPIIRERYIADLMENVRLPFLSKEYIAQRVDKEPLLEGNIVCKNLIIEALTYHLLPNEIKTCRTVPRKPVGLPKILLVIGGQAPKAIRSVECYDLREEKWCQAAEMPNRRCRAGLAVLGDKVFAVGGFNGSLRVRTVDVYDPSTDQWSTSSSMEARRSTLGVAVLNGCIYAVGGFDGTTGLSSAEMYDPKAESWRFITSMSTRRSSVGVGVVNGLLYAVGGYDGYTRQCLSSVERYNPENNAWQPVADMSARRSGAGVGVLNNILYAVGGHDGPLVRKSVEAYDQETNQWHTVANMSFCRRNAGVVAHDGLLFVVGGDDGDSNLSSVEVYSPETDTWRILAAAMTIGRSYAGVCMIDKPIQTAAIMCGIVDDENSQAEGTIEGAVGFAPTQSQQQQQQNTNSNLQQQQQQQHPYYENIYETIERYNNNGIAVNSGNAATVSANAPANEESNSLQSSQLAAAAAANDTLQPPALQQQQQQQSRLVYNNINYRNDLYDRVNAANIGISSPSAAAAASTNTNYDIPRSTPRLGFGFRRNFQLDLHAANHRFNALRCNGVACNHAVHNNNSNINPGNSTITSSSASSTTSASYNKQHSFDDTESQNYYNLNQYHASAVRYENIYEQIHDEPVYRNGARVYGRLNVIGHGVGRIERHLSSSCGNIDHYNLGGHYAVLGHSHFGTVGHIRLNAGGGGGGVSGGGVGGRLYDSGGASTNITNNGSSNASATASTLTNQKEMNNVKNSSSSFFSCLHGENTQSMSNIYRVAGQQQNSTALNTNAFSNAEAIAATGGTPNTSKEREARASTSAPLVNNINIVGNGNETKGTGAIPKIKVLNTNTNKNVTTTTATATINATNAINTTTTEKSVSLLKSALIKKSSTSSSATFSTNSAYNNIQGNNNCNTMVETNSSTLNRISKSSLQWLLVNKWLPLWMGQGADCKVIDFNFMFSRDCMNCEGHDGTTQMPNPYGTPRLTSLPQDIVRFNARAAMCCPSPTSTTYRRTPFGEYGSGGRPLHSALNRLRETETFVASNGRHRHYEDPSYENVHVQWHNGFEFGRSRDHNRYDTPNLNQKNYSNNNNRRFKNHSSNVITTTTTPSSSSTIGSNKYKYFYHNYELNSESNTFKPKLINDNKGENWDLVNSNDVVANQVNNKVTSNSVLESNIIVAAVAEELEGAVGGVIVLPPTAAIIDSVNLLDNIAAGTNRANIDAITSSSSSNSSSSSSSEMDINLSNPASIKTQKLANNTQKDI